MNVFILWTIGRIKTNKVGVGKPREKRVKKRETVAERRGEVVHVMLKVFGTGRPADISSFLQLVSQN